MVVVADNDDAGRPHARAVTKALVGVARSVTAKVSPFEKGDITDLLGGGYTIDALQLLPDEEEGALYGAHTHRTRKVSWAWPGYIPYGKVTLIEGDPGDGKSVLTIDLAARWSNGQPMPGSVAPAKPVVVILVSAEDEPEDTVLPDWRRRGEPQADQAGPAWGKSRLPFDLVNDMLWLSGGHQVRRAVVVFDPLTAFLSSGPTPTATPARGGPCTRSSIWRQSPGPVLAVRHLNKGSGKALYQGGGSIGFIGAARAAYLVAQHPDQPDIACSPAEEQPGGQAADSFLRDPFQQRDALSAVGSGVRGYGCGKDSQWAGIRPHSG